MAEQQQTTPGHAVENLLSGFPAPGSPQEVPVTKQKSALKVPSAKFKERKLGSENEAAEVDSANLLPGTKDGSEHNSKKDLKVRISQSPTVFLHEVDDDTDASQTSRNSKDASDQKNRKAHKAEISEKHHSAVSQHHRPSFNPPSSQSHQDLGHDIENNKSSEGPLRGSTDAESGMPFRKSRRPTVAPPSFHSIHRGFEDQDTNDPDEDQRRPSLDPDDPDGVDRRRLDLDDLDLRPKLSLAEEELEQDEVENIAEVEDHFEDVKINTMPLFKSSNTNSDKMSKKSKKALKKLAKMMRVVTTQLGAEQSPLPTKWVVIWGAGLGLGTPKSAIADFFSPSPVEIRLYVNKPYCTARFASKRDAASALDGMNGVELLPLQPVYMAFLGEDPPREDRSILGAFAKQWPVGLTVIPDFISDLEEEALLLTMLPDQYLTIGTDSFRRDILTDIAKAQRDKLIRDGRNRTVQDFGYEFRTDTSDVDFDNPLKEKIPDFLIPFIIRMMTHSIIFRKPEQLTLNHYLPGHGVPDHMDAHSAFDAPILILSLCSGVIMDFRDGNEKVSVHVPRRSLMVLDGEARLLWSHGIAGRSYDIVDDFNYGGLTAEHREERVALTFRLLNRRRVCECQFPHMCDSQKPQMMAEEAAMELETDLLHRLHENMPTSSNRSPWPKVREFMDSLSPGQNMLDVGCGNGTYLNLTEYIYQAGTELGKKLSLEKGRKEKSVDSIHDNDLRLPFRDESFNALICIAVLHHLTTKERRLEALREIIRILSPSAEALVYAWAKNSRLKEMKSNYIRQQALKAGRDADEKESVCLYPLRNYSFLPLQEHSDEFRSEDNILPWLNGDLSKNEEHRFYHVFERGELEDLLHELDPPPRILDSCYDQGSWCVRFRKQDPDEYRLMMEHKVTTICDDR